MKPEGGSADVAAEAVRKSPSNLRNRSIRGLKQAVTGFHNENSRRAADAFVISPAADRRIGFPLPPVLPLRRSLGLSAGA
jgi:hypothetical protein